MKKSFLFLLFLIAAIAGHSQDAAQINVFAGAQAINANYQIKHIKQPTTFKFGVQAGMGLKLMFDNNLFFAPAISYQLQGFKVKLNQPSFPPDLLAKNNNLTYHLIDIAPLLQYDFTKNQNHFFIKAGPSVQFLIMGHEEFDLATGQHISRNMKFSRTDYGRYLACINGQFGYEQNGKFSLYFHFAQELGTMANSDGPQIRPRVFGLVFSRTLRYNQ